MRISIFAALLGTGILLATAGARSQGTPSSGQTATPQQQPATPAKSKPKKKPEEPIDPDTSAGVRGNGAMHTVRVLRKGKPVQAAHVVVKNTNGSVAASCYTGASGDCRVELGADSYVIGASLKGQLGSTSMTVNDATGTIVIRLAKLKAADDAPRP